MHDTRRNDAFLLSLLALIAYLIKSQQERDERQLANSTAALADNMATATRAVGEAVTMAVTEATRTVLVPQPEIPIREDTSPAPYDVYVPAGDPPAFDPTDADWPDMDIHADTAMIPAGANALQFMGIETERPLS